MKRIVLILALLLPSLCIAAPWDMDSVSSIFAGRMPDEIEGVWQFPNDGATLLIRKQTATTYEMLMLESPNLDVRPGTAIGQAIVTPTPGMFDANLSAKALGNRRLKKANAALELVDGHLIFRPYSTGKRIAFWRWIPYLFRVSVYNEDTRPRNLDGASKVYPIDEANLHPRL